MSVLSHSELTTVVASIADTIIEEAKGDLLNALILWQALSGDLNDQIKSKIKKERKHEIPS